MCYACAWDQPDSFQKMRPGQCFPPRARPLWPSRQNPVPASVGFKTAKLHVAIHKDPLELTVTDLQGRVIVDDFPGRPIEYHGTSFRVYLKSPDDEHYFGLGDKAGPLDRRNHAFTDWNTDAFGWQESTDPIYKSIPFFITFHRGVSAGIFLDNTWRASFDFNKEYRDAYSFGSEGGPLDYYILYGPEPKAVVQSWAWLVGKTPLPPLWSLGYQQSRYSYFPESEVRRIASRLRSEHIPADVLWLDIDYQLKNRPFAVDPERFPHFDQMVQDLKAEHLRTVVITDLHVADLPGAGYRPYDEGKAGDHFVKNPDGSDYVGVVWPGKSVFPDFTRKATREWYGTLLSDFVAKGVAGFWNDMNEPAIFEVPSKTMPDDTQHRIEEPGFAPRTASHLEIHNVYGMQNTRATFEGLRKLEPNTRPFVMTRASYAGGHRYAATWTGDNSSNWFHLRQTIPQLLNLGLSGFSMCGADVGGFASTPQPELLTRWIELGAFQPIDRDHTAMGTGPQEPWENGTPEDLTLRRRYIEERYRLLPYLYTTAEEMSRTGLPIMRPMFLEFPEEASEPPARRPHRGQQLHAGLQPAGRREPISRRNGQLLRGLAAGGLVRLLDRGFGRGQHGTKKSGKDSGPKRGGSHSAQPRHAARLRARRRHHSRTAAGSEHRRKARGTADPARLSTHRLQQGLQRKSLSRRRRQLRLREGAVPS